MTIQNLTQAAAGHLQSIQQAKETANQDAVEKTTHAAVEFLRMLPDHRTDYNGSTEDWSVFRQRVDTLCEVIEDTLPGKHRSGQMAEISAKINRVSKENLIQVGSSIQNTVEKDVTNRQRVKTIRLTAKQQLEKGVPADQDVQL